MNEVSDFIPFARPAIGVEEEEAALRVLKSGWLTTGAEALGFEKEFAAFLDPGGKLGVQALAVNSATSGLHLAMEAAGVGPGDVVITTPYTFASTAEVVRYTGADVAFADVGKDSFNIDPQAVEAVVGRLGAGKPAYPPRKDDQGIRFGGDTTRDPAGFGPRGRAVVVAPVHYGGLPCDLNALRGIAQKHDLAIVEDAAHAFPSPLIDGKAPCRFAGVPAREGDFGVFSFYATKTITTGEGGMIVARSEEGAKRISCMRSHGIDRSVWSRYTDKRASWRYAIVEAGFKYNLPDLLATIGREQLKKAEVFLAERQRIATRYDAAFGERTWLRLPPGGPENAYHLYPIRIMPERLDISRDQFIEALQEAGVGVSVHFIPLHTMPYWAGRYGFVDQDFPNALDRFSTEISLPIWPGMTETQISGVIQRVLAIGDGALRGRPFSGWNDGRRA